MESIRKLAQKDFAYNYMKSALNRKEESKEALVSRMKKAMAFVAQDDFISEDDLNEIYDQAVEDLKIGKELLKDNR